MTIQTCDECCREIRLLMKYAVPDTAMDQALALVDRFSADRTALTLFKEFYSFLPEAQDDAITALHCLGRKNGVFLLRVTTLLDSYLYALSAAAAEFLGRTGDGIWDEEVLAFFGYRDRDDFLKRHETLAEVEEFKPTILAGELCPVCSVATGENHILGCPLELCPWCGGRLTSCNCRFSQLHTESIREETRLYVLLDLLDRKGRIPYDPAVQRPSYPTDR